MDHRQGYLTITAAGKRCRRNVQYCSLTMQSNFTDEIFTIKLPIAHTLQSSLPEKEILSQIYCRGAPNRV